MITYSIAVLIFVLARVGYTLRAGDARECQQDIEAVVSRILEVTTPDDQLFFMDEYLSFLHDAFDDSRSMLHISAPQLSEENPGSSEINTFTDHILDNLSDHRLVLINHSIPSTVIDAIYLMILKKCKECMEPELIQLGLVTKTIPRIPTLIYTRAMIFLPHLNESGTVFKNTHQRSSESVNDLPELIRIAGRLNAGWAEERLRQLELSSSNSFILDGLAGMVLRKLYSIPCENPQRFAELMGLHPFMLNNADWLFINHIHEMNILAPYLPESLQKVARALLQTNEFTDAPAEIFEAVKSVSRQIVHATTNEDLLVFVGNSPSYFYHLVEKVRDSVVLPFSSSRFNLNEVDFASNGFPGLDHYVDIFLKPIFDRKKPIVLVDISVSGRTINVLTRLMRSRCPDCKIEYLQLHIVQPERFSFPNSPREVHVREALFVPWVCQDFLAGSYVRLMPKLSRENWSKSSQGLVHAYKAQPEQSKVIEKIENLMTVEELLVPIVPERASPLVNLGAMSKLLGNGTPSTWLQPDLSVPLLRLTEWFNKRLQEAVTGERLVATKSQVNCMTEGITLIDNTAEEIAFRLSMMSSFPRPRLFVEEWYVDWGPQLMAMITSSEFLRAELGPVATQIAQTIQVPPEAREKFRRVMRITD